MRDNYDIGYLDGRNHALALTVKWVKSTLAKSSSSKNLMKINQKKGISFGFLRIADAFYF